MPGFSTPNIGSKCCIVFAITLGGVSSNWNNDGLRHFAVTPKKGLVGGILRLLLFKQSPFGKGAAKAQPSGGF
jgi:hypothetical protein